MVSTKGLFSLSLTATLSFLILGFSPHEIMPEIDGILPTVSPWQPNFSTDPGLLVPQQKAGRHYKDEN